MRETIVAEVEAALLPAGVPPEAVVQAESFDDLPIRPFVVVRWGPTAPGMGKVERPTVDFWVHDVKGDYSRIDRLLGLIQDRLEALAPMRANPGYIQDVHWDGNSGDLADDGYDTIVRYSSYTLTGRSR